MSIKIMSSVLERYIKPANRKMVLLVLANYADDGGGNVFPSVATIAAQSSAGERTVATALSEFRNAGIIILECYRYGGQGGKIPVYRIDIERVREIYPLALVKAAENKKKGANGAGLNKKKGANPDNKAASGAGLNKKKAANPAEKPANDDKESCNSFAENPLGTVRGEDARAQGAEPGNIGDGDDKPPPACAWWDSKYDAMVKALPPEDVCKVDDAIVHSDDGKLIILWLESDPVKQDFDGRLRQLLEPVLQRTVITQVNKVAAQAKQRRLAGRVLANTDAAIVDWSCARPEMIELFGENEFESWLEMVTVTGGPDGEMILHCPTEFIRAWVEEHHAAAISELLGRAVIVVYGHEHKAVAHG